jgi:hypothetical protein
MKTFQRVAVAGRIGPSGPGGVPARNLIFLLTFSPGNFIHGGNIVALSVTNFDVRENVSMKKAAKKPAKKKAPAKKKK